MEGIMLLALYDTSVFALDDSSNIIVLLFLGFDLISMF